MKAIKKACSGASLYPKSSSVSSRLKSGGKVTKAKDGKWIQSATASIKKRGTKGVCTGAKFGGPT